MKTKDLSLVDIAAEASKRRRFDEEPFQEKRSLLLLGGFILLIAGLAIGGWLIFFKGKTSSQETVLQPPKSPVFSEKQEIIGLKSERRSELIFLVREKLNSPVAVNSVLNIPIYLETEKEKTFIQGLKLFQLLEINPPADFVQSLEGSFALGVFNLKKNTPFLIFKIRSFDLAFNGALNWEKNMAKDLKEILLIQNIPQASQKFQDKIVKNHDSRVLYNASSSPVIIYSFAGKDYFITTTDIDTLEEIFNRLSGT